VHRNPLKSGRGREEVSMESALVSRETPMEFFRMQLSRAMEHQRVSTSAFTEWYLVNLLAACVRGDALPQAEAGYDETPLSLLYVRAIQASRAERGRLLRSLGDTALFVSGFFADSLPRHLVDLHYYRVLGGRAYARLGMEDGAVAPGVFQELGRRFMEFVDLLQEVSDASRLGVPTSTVKLYERWLETGSRRAALLLARDGILPLQPGSGVAH
jgi:hypothetical protein